MLNSIRSLWRQFFTRTRTINNEPLNKVSLIVVILVDIFILINVFNGLYNISTWHITPEQAYPCYSQWVNYRSSKAKDKDFQSIQQTLAYQPNNQVSVRQTYQQIEQGHLGKVSSICLNYAEAKDKIKNPENQEGINIIAKKQDKIANLETTNRNIKEKYDSTLLEKIAGQPRQQSINGVSADQAKQEIEQNSSKIATIKSEISTIKSKLLAQPENISLIAFLKNETQFKELEQGYKGASFWYPSIQLILESIFLLPLILIAVLVNNFSQRRGYGLISLISWHLLVIFFIPLVFKLFEFLQFGAISKFIFDIIVELVGNLLFLVSYIYILLIPLIGFGIIQFFQKVVFNPKAQAVSRVQKSQCIHCAKKIRQQDAYCPHCGYYQYTDCSNCHTLTYKALPYCHHCGHQQDSHPQ